MPPTARLGDPTCHRGAPAGPGMPTVLVGGAPAAVLGDPYSCALPPLAGPHPPNVVIAASATVLLGGVPAARVRDARACACGAVILAGLPTVIIGR